VTPAPRHKEIGEAAPPSTAAPGTTFGASLVSVGTCSWTDPTLTKQTDWYPRRSMSAAERLGFYASQFSLVEVDSTYYSPPKPDVVHAWAQRVPAGFVFDVKAYGLLTGHPVQPLTLWPDIREQLAAGGAQKSRAYPHHLPPDALDEVWARFTGALSPLAETGRLGAVLFQYPPWFMPNMANRSELERLPERLGGVPACVEFRSPKWLVGNDLPRTLAILRDLGLAFVVVDAPAASGLPTVLEATRDDLAVVRFHGRADSTWNAKNVPAAERFRYLYSEKELAEWVPRARRLAAESSRVHLLMNNCYQDYGVRNAAELGELLLSESQAGD